jgi:hypothetical protein
VAFDYAPSYEAIRLAVATALALPDRTAPNGVVTCTVDYRNRRSSARFVSHVWVDLRPFSLVNVGRDETRYDQVLVPGGDPELQLRPVMRGTRRVRIEAHVRSDSQEMDASAYAAADRIRTRIRSPRIKAILQGANVGYEAADMAYESDYRDADNRMISEAIIDMVFLFSVLDRDDAAEDFGWVDTVQGTGALVDGALAEDLVSVSISSTDPAPIGPGGSLTGDSEDPIVAG